MAGLSLIKQLGITGTQYTTLSALTETGYAASEVVSRARAIDPSLKASVARTAVRQIQKIISTRPYVKSVNLNANLNHDRLPYALTETLRDYSYTAYLNVIDNRTGEETVLIRKLSTDTLLTKQEALDAFETMFDEDDEEGNYGYEFEGGTVTQVLRQNPDA